MKKLHIILYLLIGFNWQACAQLNNEVSSTKDLTTILEEFHNPSSSKILVAAHRASNKLYPENSLAAIEYSYQSGVDMVELDVRTTKDGKIVLMHDNTIDRTTNGEGKVSDFTYAQLLTFTLDANSNDTIVHQIPLAEEAFALAKGKIMIDIDIKEVSVKQLVELVHRTNMEDQVLFFDSSFDILDSVLILDSTLMLMPRAHSLEETIQIIARYNPPIIHIDDDFYTSEVVETIKNSGARVWINALGVPDNKALVNKDLGYKPVLAQGANVVQTDYPFNLKSFLLTN